VLDELQSAGDPDVAPHLVPKWVRAVLVLLGAAAASVGLLHQLDQHPTKVAAHVRSTPVPSGAVPSPAATAHSTSCAAAAPSEPMTGHRADWPPIKAPTGRGPAGVAVLAWASSPVLRVDVGTGEVSRPVLCVGAVDAVFPVAVPWAQVMNVDDRGHRRVWWVDPGGQLGELAGDEQTGTGTSADAPSGAYAVPGLSGSLLVVSSTAQGQTLSRFASGTATPTVTRLDSRYDVVGEVAAGLVVRLPVGARPDSNSGRLLLLDPRTHRVTRFLGTENDDRPIIQGDAIAWIAHSPCRADCTLRVLDTASWSTRDVVLPGTHDPSTIWKAFSPSGTSIALSYTDITSIQGRAGPGHVLVVDLAHRRMTTVPGIGTTGNGQALGATWSADGRWLVLSTSNSMYGRFAVWSTQSHRLTAMPWVVALDISQDLLSTASGALGAWH
jgi:hypothetical protein